MPLFRSMIYQALKGTLLRVLRPGGPKPDLLAVIAGKAGFNKEDEDWLALARQLMDGSQRMNLAMPAVLSDAELRAIQAPTLLLIAEHEILYEPQSTLRTAMTRMPGLTGEIVPGAHHLAAMAQPDAVNARIVDFLSHSSLSASTPTTWGLKVSVTAERGTSRWSRAAATAATLSRSTRLHQLWSAFSNPSSLTLPPSN